MKEKMMEFKLIDESIFSDSAINADIILNDLRTRRELKFCEVFGISEQGDKIADILKSYATGRNNKDPYLLIEYVLTDFEDILEYRKKFVGDSSCIGYVVVSHNLTLPWVTSLYDLTLFRSSITRKYRTRVFGASTPKIDDWN